MLNIKYVTTILFSFGIAVANIQTSANAADQKWTFDGAIHNNSLAVSPDETMAVASYSERQEIVVYDLKSKSVRKILRGYITPRNSVFDPSGKAFYVSDSSLGVIKKIDATSLEEIGQFAAGPGVFGTTISADGKTLYANNEAANTVTSFNLNTNQPTAVIPGFSQPRQGVRLNPNGDTLFVTNFLGDKITLVNTKTNQIDGEIAGFNKIRAISISHDGKTLYAANSGSNMIAVVNIADRKITSMIPVGKDPYGAALTPDGKFLYSGNLADNSLTVISLPSEHVVASVDGLKQPRQAIVFSHNSKLAYVLNEDLSVAIINLDNNKIAEVILPH
ncbi:YncE family protein [Solimicrobium silvestre]|uniref:40-residue YVTN family beta-propeller repeat protein n=1 Tax=Solimicrobium silvestre TaxID=2099400 RepID=A0A2S9H0A9_9BURK|nr:beta-propeller fold lactonase family protein [Solimicrobium silvestre]PRC93415.1 40-residue YVTN family beta-propeller repeat protein [Solimicrobium silvestre]